jgi:hypothetical protein
MLQDYDLYAVGRPTVSIQIQEEVVYEYEKVGNLHAIYKKDPKFLDSYLTAPL